MCVICAGHVNWDVTLAARTPGARAAIGWRDVAALLDIGPSDG